jgi:acyl-coenzyme A synthetase/AMP-(fatty) acid ligase
VPACGRALDETAVLAFCRKRLASFKKPRRAIFVEELPKNAYGRGLRRILRERFQIPEQPKIGGTQATRQRRM